jgi:hypothetical protein
MKPEPTLAFKVCMAADAERKSGERQSEKARAFQALE